MKLKSILATSALALTLAAPALAGQQTWTLKLDQADTTQFGTTMTTYFVGAYNTKAQCVKARNARQELLGPQLPPCVWTDMNAQCSTASEFLHCDAGLYANIE